MADGRRSAWTLAAFAGPCIPLAAFGLPLVITIPHYYSKSLGLNFGLVSLAFLLVRLVDILFDPFFGTVLDRTRWAFGRFKGWMAISVPILFVSIYMLFMAKPGATLGYLWFWLLIVYLGYSIAVLSHTAWASTLSTAYHQRSRIYAFWQSGNVLGMIFILALPVVLLAMGQIKSAQDTVHVQGWFILALLPLMTILALWRVPEPKVVEVADFRRATLGDYFRLLRRPTVARILAADLLTGLGPGVAGTLFFYYFQEVKGFDQKESIALLLIYFVSAIFGAAIWTRLAKKGGKAKALIAACVVYAIVQFLVVLLPAGNFLMAIPFLIAAGLPYSAGALLLRSMLADFGDEERLDSGQDRTGLLYAILTGTVKIGSALALISGLVLTGLGFDGTDPSKSTELSMQGLQAMYAFVPGVIGLLAAACLIGYPLTEKKHEEILRRLGERDSASPPPQPEDVVAIAPDALSSPAE